MDTQSIRSAAINAPRKQEDVATPFWEGTDGGVALSDVPANELIALNPLAKVDQSAHTAALVCAALINKETGERIFSDADRDTVAALGGSILFGIMKQANIFFGFDSKMAIDEAKKN